ncbi:MAG: response regulator [Thermodesulfobacteriota bacterium]
MDAKILVVDDDPLLREMLVSNLETEGYTPHNAADAAEAIALLQQGEYMVVITDKNMPGTEHRDEGGLDVLAFARQQIPDCAVIMITGYATADSAIEALRLGAFDYLHKPFDLTELNNKIRRIFDYLQTINPRGTLAAYSSFRDDMLTLLGLMEERLGSIPEKYKEQFISSLQQKLDVFFSEGRRREFFMIEQRDRLGEIASLASRLLEVLPDNAEALELTEAILRAAEQRL